ncbi:helix-turn-helix domain-containing protein [Sunxiuqinia elliptica]|uniref:AraC-like DNA-binding protein n=1 Tax=Sunxiuqinia elliptica TaxID=655355 RepID=A0A4R6HA53_9BACT|nr:helix-turn-helix transcriptional regulator [Sunxiuqinia elliptica]TDO05220.1 AraC-like DNA-binding protein [Sunxiuqinia elliptica]TDO64769.1 AraC-like DNA-binding protein [Sunxiuqinia elliptica]
MLDQTTLVLLTPFFVTLFWILVISTSQYQKENKKLELLFFLTCGLVAFISAIAFFGRYYKLYQLIYVPVVFFAMSQFPAFYVYIKSLTSEQGWERKSLVHFIIPLLTTLAAAYIHCYLLSERENYEFVTKVISGEVPETTHLKQAYLVDRISKNSFIILGLIYYWLTNRRVKKHRSKLDHYFSSTEGKRINWIRLYNISFFFTLFAGIFFHSLDRKVFIENQQLLALPFLPLTVFFWIIGFHGHKQETIYPIPLNQPLLDNQNPIQTSDLSDIKIRLITLLDNEKLYLNPEINLPDLARHIGTNRTYLSQVINQEFSLNFNQFINKYRTEEAKKRLNSQEGYRLTMKELGEQCGFNTPQSFARWFREYYGVTPGEYKKTIGL